MKTSLSRVFVLLLASSLISCDGKKAPVQPTNSQHGPTKSQLKMEPQLQEGGIYVVESGKERGDFAAAKILKIEDDTVHVRLYRNRYKSIPESLDPATLTIGKVTDPDGFGIGHMPLSKSHFLGWKPVLVAKQPVSESELEGYRLWKGEAGDTPARNGGTRNPQYQAWARGKVGTWVKYEVRVPTEGRTHVSYELLELIAKTPERVVVETRYLESSGGKEVEIRREETAISALLPKDAESADSVVAEGEEVIEAAGKRLPCRWRETRTKWFRGTIIQRVWWSGDIPGGKAKETLRTDDREGPGTTRLLNGFQW